MLLPNPMMERFRWRAARLRCMSVAEVFHRLAVLMKSNLEKRGFFIASYPPVPNLSKHSVHWFGDIKNEDPAPYRLAADKILRGELDVFDLSNHHLGEPPEWNRDPLTGKIAPMVFGKTLDYRNEELVGNIKYVWEPSRHLHLVTLAQAYHLSRSDGYLEGLKLQLTSWFDQCPYLMGPQWSSSLEIGIRLINWYLVWQLIGGIESSLFKGKDGNVFRARWLQSIYQHVHFINSHYSRYSSANNHLIGEAAGVFIATTGWPFWSEFGKWQENAAEILERETLLQNTNDGVNREQALAYQQFVLDFLLLSKLTASANKFEFSKRWVSRVEKMLEFLASIMDTAGHLPMIGDADDGFVVKLCQGDNNWCPYRSLLAEGAVLFNRADFAVKSKYYDVKSRWLLGASGSDRFDRLSPDTVNLPIKRDFKQGGYFILGNDFECEHEVRMIVDAGPLGYLSIAAHGHADALSMTLFVGGKEILIDPGTYAYHTQKQWRDYFRGTSAHNTVRVDEQDQSVIGGNFMWLRKANVVGVTWNSDKDEDTLLASHDGYSRFSDPVHHKRTIRYNKISRKIYVIDAIKCKEDHLVELFWHFGECCRVEEHSTYVSIRNGSVTVKLQTKSQLGAKLRIVSGMNNPPLGWVSPRFGVKNPISTVVYTSLIHGDMEFRTEFAIEFNDSVSHDSSALVDAST